MFLAIVGGLGLIVLWFYMVVRGGYFFCTIAAGICLLLDLPIVYTYFAGKFWDHPVVFVIFITLHAIFTSMAIIALLRKYVWRKHCPFGNKK
ncbi:MAG TPA: hypothetical protein PK367_01380 [Candidatus Paceibacterota bacterium]|nr:hypothetical protein [Candidatus Paceibacterota bacterium]